MKTDYMKQKLLVLAGAAVHSKVVSAAKEMGVYTIVTDFLENSPAEQIADESWMLSIVDVDGIVERGKKEHIDGVLNFCIDPAQIPYQKIAEKFGLPCCGTAEQFRILTDKALFKEFCSQVGVDMIPDYTEQDVEEDLVEYPIFVKPAESRGSRGQSICYAKKETCAAIAQAKE